MFKVLFRMRGIGKGQTIQLFLIPEVSTINKSILWSERVTSKQMFNNFVAWLVINSMKSESIQFNNVM